MTTTFSLNNKIDYDDKIRREITQLFISQSPNKIDYDDKIRREITQFFT